MFSSVKSIFSKVKFFFEFYRDLNHIDKKTRNLIREIQERKLTYLSEKKLVGLLKACMEVEKKGVQGSFIEAGCALGGSAILIASCKFYRRPFYIHDVFGMIPEPTYQDPPDVHERYKVISLGDSIGIGGETYYGYRDNLREVVIHNLKEFSISLTQDNVHLIPGLVQDTIQGDEPVALAHIDVDWYEPVDTCLRRLFPRLSMNGVIILDDYYDWGGCKSATDDFLKEIEGQYTLSNFFGSLIIIKIAADSSIST